MFKRSALFLSVRGCAGMKAGLFKLLAVAVFFATGLNAVVTDEAIPERASGRFVQRKTLADVEVTITSKGKYEFEKGKYFAWHTLEPLESVFVATPTNYAMTVNGKTTSHRLKNDVTSVAKIFEIKEVKDFVKEITTVPETGFPQRLRVDFKNGDKLDIEFLP